MKRMIPGRSPRQTRLAACGACLMLMIGSAMLTQAQAADGFVANHAYALAQADAPAAVKAGDAELKALTEQVLQSLGAVTGATGGKQPAQKDAEPASPGDYQALMNALTTLVEKATRQGKSSEDVYALIQEALASQDDKTLAALIARAGGKVELQRLLRSLVQKAALQAAQPNDPYTRMLQAEGEATSMLEGGARRTAAAAAGKPTVIATPQGRSIIVQPGDTLSIIALRVYGNVRKWRDIYDANRDRLNNPDLVPAGMRLRLP